MTRLGIRTVLALILWGCAVGFGQTQNAAAVAPDASHAKAAQIVARMLEKNRERLAALERYSSDRTYRVEYTTARADITWRRSRCMPSTPGRSTSN